MLHHGLYVATGGNGDVKLAVLEGEEAKARKAVECCAQKKNNKVAQRHHMEKTTVPVRGMIKLTVKLRYQL